MTFLADVGDSIKALVSAGRKLDSPGYSGGSSAGFGGSLFGTTFWGNSSPGAGINYAQQAGELRFNSIVAACLQARYKAISAAPPYLAQKKGDKWDRVRSHPLQTLLDVPNGHYGRNDLWGVTDGARCANGSGFWRVTWSEDHLVPGEIMWESDVAPVYDEQSFIREYMVGTGREQVRFAAAANFDWSLPRSQRDYRPAIVQFRYQLDPYNARNGWSPLQTVVRQIATDNGLSGSLAAVVRNAAMPGWAVTPNSTGGVDGFVTPNEIEQVRTMLDKLTRGEGRGRSIATNAAVKFDKLTLNPDDVASPKINSFDVERICAVLGVPPLLIGLNTDSNATYANQEQADKKFWHSMLLEMDSIGDSLEGQMFPLYQDLDRDKFCILWDTSTIEPLQESQDAKFTRASTGTNKAAFLTVNEARELVGKPLLEKPQYNEIPSAPAPAEPSAETNAAANSAGEGRPVPPQLKSVLQVLAARDEGEDFEAKRFNPDQPRESDGQWASGGSSSESEGGESTPSAARKGTMRAATEAEKKAMGIPPAYHDVQVTDDKDAELRATAKSEKGKTQYYYTPAYSRSQAAAKFIRVRSFHQALPAMRARWDAEIARNGPRAHEAMALRLIAQTGFRNGGLDGGGDEAAYGASSLLMSHVQVHGDRISFNFSGKGGHAQVHSLIDPLLARHIEARRQEGRETVFDTNDSKVRDYLKQTGGDFKVHDLRTRTASAMAAHYVGSLEAGGHTPTAPLQTRRARNAIADKVAAKLGDTRGVVLSSYIDPQVFEGWPSE